MILYNFTHLSDQDVYTFVLELYQGIKDVELGGGGGPPWLFAW